MIRVSSGDCVRNFSRVSDEALTRPIVLTRNGRDRLLLVSIEQIRFVIALAEMAADEPEDMRALSKLLPLLQ